MQKINEILNAITFAKLSEHPEMIPQLAKFWSKNAEEEAKSVKFLGNFISRSSQYLGIIVYDEKGAIGMCGIMPAPKKLKLESKFVLAPIIIDPSTSEKTYSIIKKSLIKIALDGARSIKVKMTDIHDSEAFLVECAEGVEVREENDTISFSYVEQPVLGEQEYINMQFATDFSNLHV